MREIDYLAYNFAIALVSNGSLLGVVDDEEGDVIENVIKVSYGFAEAFYAESAARERLYQEAETARADGDMH